MHPEISHELLQWIRGRFFGKYRGTVKDNADQTKRGRLKVSVPSVLGDLELWAMPCVPYAGKKLGFYALPDPDTGVWVEFEGGDPSFPIWTGFFWGDDELPDDSDANIKTLKTSAVTLRIHDGDEELRIEATSGGKIALTQQGEVTTESGNAKTTVSTSAITSELGSSKLALDGVTINGNGGALVVT